ncbi:hypothetical protein LPJ61_001366 [Coemansia biformis]|uniref:Uncharacterized protein n=1 Tax=Coemansia biformis TaxID=1286918 RepID=A0A9W8D056_9FUNG|nr:hypothetical protein LPJ61_001366 [Coemansia biformis]
MQRPTGDDGDVGEQRYRRGGRTVGQRLMLMGLVSGGAGALLGGYLGAGQSARQYLAERAHRLPTTVEGWFFYHKWKNYRVLLGSMKGAARYAPRLAGCVVTFAAAETLLDRLFGHVQMASSVIASTATAVGVSLAARLPKSSARRARMAGLGVGLAVGAAQDFVGWASGHPPVYVAWAREQLARGR